MPLTLTLTLTLNLALNLTLDLTLTLTVILTLTVTLTLPQGQGDACNTTACGNADFGSYYNPGWSAVPDDCSTKLVHRVKKSVRVRVTVRVRVSVRSGLKLGSGSRLGLGSALVLGQGPLINPSTTPTGSVRCCLVTNGIGSMTARRSLDAPPHRQGKPPIYPSTNAAGIHPCAHTPVHPCTHAPMHPHAHTPMGSGTTTTTSAKCVGLNHARSRRKDAASGGTGLHT